MRRMPVRPVSSTTRAARSLDRGRAAPARCRPGTRAARWRGRRCGGTWRRRSRSSPSSGRSGRSISRHRAASGAVRTETLRSKRSGRFGSTTAPSRRCGLVDEQRGRGLLVLDDLDADAGAAEARLDDVGAVEGRRVSAADSSARCRHGTPADSITAAERELVHAERGRGDGAAGGLEAGELEQRLRAAGLAGAAVEAVQRPGRSRAAWRRRARPRGRTRRPSRRRSAARAASTRTARRRGSRAPRCCWAPGTTGRCAPSRRTAPSTPAPASTRSACRPVRMLMSCSAEGPPKTTVALLTTWLSAPGGPTG